MNTESNAEKLSKKMEKRVCIDFRPVLIQLERETGSKIGVMELSEEIGFTRVATAKWEKAAPPVVAMIYYFLKENPTVKFEDLVKEVVSHD